MTPLERLTALLCECESVKKDVMELRFGCRISQHSHCKKETIYLWETPNEDSCMWSNLFYTYDIRNEFPYWESSSEYSDDFRGNNKHNDFNIIWNPIEERHLRMYCIENQILCSFENSWYIMFVDNRNTPKSHIIEYDDSKPLYQQSNETLEKIVKFLESNK